MAKNDSELFDRLRQVGLRKKVAKALSEVSHGAGSRTQRAARAAANELRALADEIERRLPAEPASDASAAKRTPARRTRQAKPAGSRSAADRPTKRAATTTKRTTRSSTARKSSGSRSPAPSGTTESKAAGNS
jgi:hypothetical protein